MGPVRSTSLPCLSALLLIVVLAPSAALGAPPVSGFARPPLWIKGHAATGPKGLTPAKVRRAYGFDRITNQGAGQIIAIVDAYHHPYANSDLNLFSRTFGLPQCNSTNPCFQKVYASGVKPPTDPGWALEIALDVQWAHAIAPKAKILLVEAASANLKDMMKAIDVAVRRGASVVSMSWGATEFSQELALDTHFAHNNVSFVASSGDNGSGIEYPAASPYVVSVGGTTLTTDSLGNYLSERAWSGSGGGRSQYESEPSYQSRYPIPNDARSRRGVPDVAYDGDPATGFAVYSTVKYAGQSGWFQLAGTSAGAPQWAGLFAIANSMRRAAGKATLSHTNEALYTIAKLAYGATFHDIPKGDNGSCGSVCTAATNYDFVTGLGSPRANNLLKALTAY